MPGETIETIAERLERAADRSDNAGFSDVARDARGAAVQVRAAPDVAAGLEIERAFLAAHADASDALRPTRSWWWWLIHPGSWFSSSDDYYSDDS